MISWDDIKLNISKMLVPSFFDRYDLVQSKLHSLEYEYTQLNTFYQEKQSEYDSLIQTYDELEQMYIDSQLTPFEFYCQQMFDEVEPFPYQDKFEYSGKTASMYPNELITPRVYAIQYHRDRIRKQYKDKIGTTSHAQALCLFVDDMIKYNSDKTLFGMGDAWLLPLQALMKRTDDCEGHAVVLASMEPDWVGYAHGQYIEKSKKIPHAFGVALIGGELYVLETNNVADVNAARILKYNGQSTYVIQWIYTETRTFKVGNHRTYFGHKVK